MKRLLLGLLLLCGMSSTAQAATWYIRADGGTNIQCTGLADAAYPGTGSAQPCAVKHWFYINRYITDDSTGRGGTQLVQGGDTVIVGAPNGSGGTNDKFEMGQGTVAWPGCNYAFTYGCMMDAVPSGPSAANMTKIYGRGWDTGCTGTKAQFWGTRGTRTVMNFRGSSNVDWQCMEVTDHSACAYASPQNACDNSGNTGEWARRGAWYQDSSNNKLINIDIHGIADRAMFLFRPGGTWAFSKVRIVANTVGIDQDDGSTPNDAWPTGILNVDNMDFDFQGCREKYPLVAALGSPNNITPASCTSQGQGLFTDSWGMGDGSPGTINMRDSRFRWSTQDGFDCQHCEGGGTMIFSRIHTEGNSGMQLKFGNRLTRVENSVLIANCNFYDAAGNNPLTYTGSGGFDNVCRGPGGNAIAFANAGLKQEAFIYNNMMIGNAALFLINNTSAPNCTPDSQWVSRNNIYIGGEDPLKGVGAGNKVDAFYNDGSGTCAGRKVDSNYDILWNLKNNVPNASNSATLGAFTRYVNPQITNLTIMKMDTYPYYQGYDGLNQITLSATSPARFSVTGVNAADESLTFSSFGTNDFYNNVRPATNWDGGPIQYGSVPPSGGTSDNGATCLAGSQCTSGICCYEMCAASTCQALPTTNPNTFNMNGSFGG